jgi:uncharacterized protein
VSVNAPDGMTGSMTAAPEPITVNPPASPAVAPLPVALHDVTFLHWRYDPELVRPLLPPDTEPDTFDEAAYVGLVALRIRSCGEFLQFNVRTYSVDQRNRRGVVFLAMEANRLPWVLAARAAGLPYRWSRTSLTRDVNDLDYRAARRWPNPTGVGTRIQVRVGQPMAGTSLDHFLTARWRLHCRVPVATLTARFTHNRWPLHAAELLELHDELLATVELPPPTAPPVNVLYSPGVHGRFGLPAPA